MKQRRINATLKRALPPIAALALTTLLILAALPRASTAAPTVASLSTNPKRINESAEAHSFIRSPFADSTTGTTTRISAAPRLERQPLESLTALNSTDLEAEAAATESDAPLTVVSVPSVASVVQSSGTTTRVSAALGSGPVMFIENVGQLLLNEPTQVSARASLSLKHSPSHLRHSTVFGSEISTANSIILSQSGFVEAEAIRTQSSCTGVFGLYSPTNVELFSDYQASIGETTNAGSFDAGTELIFYLNPTTPFCAGESFLSTDPQRCRVTQIGTDAWQLAWEDWADGDFNDIVFEVRLATPTPFLDLPFDYGGSVQAFRQALLDTYDDDKGRVDSWFDHEYPYGWGSAKPRTNGWLRLYDGKVLDDDPYNETLGCYEERCYDGHDGIDFAHLEGDPPDLPIHPADSGEVVKFEDKCVKGKTDCGGGFGNYVIIDHKNGYFTLYAHLKEVQVGIQSVTTDTTLGTMGATGNVSGGDGTHLHFGVYRDDGDGIWEDRSQDKPVDPYGWNGDEGGTDPWVEAGGEASYHLWIHELRQPEVVSGAQGAVITDTTGDVQATIPADAFSGSATFELSPGPVAGSSAQLHSSVRSFWLRLLEWLLESGDLQSATALQSTTQFTLTKPITLTVTYTDTDVLHLDVSQLALHRWDEEQETWQPLTTTVDLANHVVTAQTEDLGDFDLQAPLLCATDDLEPDDGYAAARWVWPNDWPLPRGLDIPQDSDWVRFDAVQGVTYTISTQNLAAGADTVLNLYDVDALTLLDSNDDADGGPASELVWTAPYTGTFFVETVSAPGGTTDCSATYELTVATIPGDVIADCQVDIADIMEVASRWRLSAANPDPDNDPITPNYETRFDLDKDGDIDIVDIMLVVVHWGETCE